MFLKQNFYLFGVVEEISSHLFKKRIYMIKQRILVGYISLLFAVAWNMDKADRTDEEFKLYDNHDKDDNLQLFRKIVTSNIGHIAQLCYKEKPFDINMQPSFTQDTLLHFFIKNLITNVRLYWKAIDGATFKFLFDNKADPNIKNKKGYAPLHTALEAGFFSDSLIKILLDNKADPNQDCNNRSPLYIFLDQVRDYQQEETVKAVNYLLLHKADPNWQKKGTNESVFNKAMEKQHINYLVLEPFLNHGVNPCLYYDYENLPYHYIDVNRAYNRRVAYFMYLNAIPEWFKQERKNIITAFLVCMKCLKNAYNKFPLPPKRLLNHFIFNYILPDYGETKDAIKLLDEKNITVTFQDRQAIDKKIKRFIALYS